MQLILLTNDNHNLHVPILFSRPSHQIRYQEEEEVVEEVFMIMPMMMGVKNGLLLILT